MKKYSKKQLAIYAVGLIVAALCEKDLLRHMYRVSGKNKEIPQMEEEYEQKTKWS